MKGDVSKKIKERVSPCSVCGYPISEKHHMAERHIYGDNDYTIKLCANCHELFHILKTCKSDVKRGWIALQFLIGSKFDERFVKIKELAEQSSEFDVAMIKKVTDENK